MLSATVTIVHASVPPFSGPRGQQGANRHGAPGFGANKPALPSLPFQSSASADGLPLRVMLGHYGSERAVPFKPVRCPSVRIRHDRGGRTFRFAHVAVNAFIRMDCQHVLAHTDAVHRTRLQAIHIFALDTVFDAHIGRRSSSCQRAKRETARAVRRRSVARGTLLSSISRGARVSFALPASPRTRRQAFASATRVLANRGNSTLFSRCTCITRSLRNLVSPVQSARQVAQASSGAVRPWVSRSIAEREAP